MDPQLLIILCVLGGIVALAIQLWIAVAIANVARRKGKSWAAFFWLSFLVSWIVMLIIVVVLPEAGPGLPREPKGKLDDVAATPVQCKFCKETVRADAEVCKHCGNEIVPQAPELLAQKLEAELALQKQAEHEAEQREAAWLAAAPMRRKRNIALLISSACVVVLIAVIAVVVSVIPRPSPFQEFLTECSVTEGYSLLDNGKTIVLHESMGYENQGCVTVKIDAGIGLKVYGKKGKNSGWDDIVAYHGQDPFDVHVEWTSTDTDKAEITMTAE